MTRSVEPPPETRGAPLPTVAFVGVGLVSALILAMQSRNVFLFWDDFLFLGQARNADLIADYLGEPLFTHFSPVVRFVNWAVVDHLAAHPWLLPAIMISLLTATIASSIWLLLTLFGRTWTAMVGAVLLGPTLSLVPLGNWWTAGVNILPAVIGMQIAFASVVLIVRGRSVRWAVPAVGGVVLAVLDYELGALMPGYLGLWVLLFRSRVTTESLVRLLRRTWWVWGLLIAVSAASLLNYRLKYYTAVPPPVLPDAAAALVLSLFRTLVPSALGFHDPKSGWFSMLSLVIGILVMAVLLAATLRRRGAWRGWLFAAAGWLAPCLALLLNRVGLYGVVVADNAIYFYAATMLFVVGGLEAVRAAAAAISDSVVQSDLHRRRRAAVGVATLVVGGAAYTWSAVPTAVYQLPFGASGSYVDQVRQSAAAVRAEVGDFSVLNTDVPSRVIPPDFGTFNRATNVLGITVDGLRFDNVAEPQYVLDDAGRLLPAQLEWRFEVTFDAGAVEGTASLLDAEGVTYTQDRGTCFTATATTQVSVNLPEPVVGDRLVVRSLVQVESETTEVLDILPVMGGDLVRANIDRNYWTPGDAGRLDTVASKSIAGFRFSGLTAGTPMCLSSLAVGVVSAS